MKTNHILALLAFVVGIAAAFTRHSENNELYPDWKFQKSRVDGRKVTYISASHLANLLYSKDQDLIVFDTREWDAYEQYHIPQALPYETGMESKVSVRSGTTVLLGDSEDPDLIVLAREIPGRVYLLRGGMEEWYSLVLFPDFLSFSVRNSDQLAYILRRSNFFGGKPQNTQLLNINVRESRYREGC